MHTLHPGGEPNTCNHESNRWYKIALMFVSGLVICLLLLVAFNRQFAIDKLGGTTMSDDYGTQDYIVGEILDIKEDKEVDNIYGDIDIVVEVGRGDSTREIHSMVSKSDIGFYNEQDGVLLNEGDEVILMKTNLSNLDEYYIVDVYRLDDVIYVILFFIVVSVLCAGFKGISSFLGLCLSILVLVLYIVPGVMSGGNPVFYTIVGSTGIVFVALYLAHGFNLKTTIALFGTLISIIISIVMAELFIRYLNLVGVGSEEALYLVSDSENIINLRGVLLSGIIIGTLGVLDDITTAQAAIVEELKRANQKLYFKELYFRATNVGREHIASLVNTLIMAYAGSSFPLFIVVVMSSGAPLWVTLSKEFIVEEVVRTVVGSVSLILAVPITTVLASYVYSRKRFKKN